MNLYVAECIVNLQLLISGLQKLSADSLANKKEVADQFQKIMDIAAIGWVRSTDD